MGKPATTLRANNHEIMTLVDAMVDIEERLCRAGLYRTHQKMKEASREVGFEVADLLKKKKKAKAKPKPRVFLTRSDERVEGYW